MTFKPRARLVARRNALPNSIKECSAVLLFMLGGVFLLWYELCHILPTYQQEDSSHSTWEIYTHYTFAVFFAINIYGNMYKLMTTDTSQARFMFMSSSFLPDGWRYCSECDLNLPPRSHHCKLCNTCVLKRDHHCWFSGCCVGFFNHRYYFCMVFHMVVAGLYCNILNLDFVVSIKGHLTLYNLISYIGPHLGWMFGYYDRYVFAITGLTTIGTVLFGIFVWLLKIQIVQIIFGQTAYEAKKNITIYNAGVLHNMKEVLGRRWFLVLLFPWISSPPFGNGYQFKVKSE